jgi:single-strand DNA-binding protein
MLNKVMLIGNAGKDPEIKTLPNGNRIAKFSLATTEYWKNKNGEQQSSTEWHNIIIYNENFVNFVSKYVSKGSKLYLEGKIVSNKYTDSNNIERLSYQIQVSEGKIFNDKKIETKIEENTTSQVANDELDDDMPF